MGKDDGFPFSPAGMTEGWMGKDTGFPLNPAGMTEGWAWSRIWDAQQFLITFAVLLSRGRFWVAPVEGEGRKRDFCEGQVKREIIREFFIQMPNP